MPFPEGRGPNDYSLARQGLGGELSSLDHRLYCGDGKTSKPQAVSDAALRLIVQCGPGS
jgi:hypothetical protein